MRSFDRSLTEPLKKSRRQGISTTNLLASTTPPPDGTSETTPAQRKIIQTTISTSLITGLLVTTIIFTGAEPLLRWIAGPKSAALIPKALLYVRIRAMTAPLAIVGMVSQAICLASVDVVTPAAAVVLCYVIYKIYQQCQARAQAALDRANQAGGANNGYAIASDISDSDDSDVVLLDSDSDDSDVVALG